MAALGAPGKDRLGRRVTCKNNPLQNIAQAPIGSNLESRRQGADDVIGCDVVGGCP